MAHYRHWQNDAGGGECRFISTYFVNYADLLGGDALKDLMTASLIRDCRQHAVSLHAFVVMSGCVHLLATVPASMDVATFVQEVKASSTERVIPFLDAGQRLEFGEQIWQSGARKWLVKQEASFNFKMIYIERTPVRDGLVSSVENYRWSSAWLVANGFVDEFGAMDLDRALDCYEAREPQREAN